MSTDKILKKWLFVFLIGLLISACQPQTATSTYLPPTKLITPTSTQTPTQTATPTSQPIQTPMTPTSTEYAVKICSPLEKENFETLSSIIVNPLEIPAFGRDDGHHGVDFAYYRRGDQISIQGIEVYAILSGKTILTLDDHTPYGYTIVIETPLSDLPQTLQDIFSDLYQTLPEEIFFQGECPEIEPPKITGDLSIYHLYAHLEEKPSISPGDLVSCGALLGTVGNSGRSSNPHLHLETRLGPSNTNPGDMGFYETIYTEQQRANYCLWRMSGYFQLFDPFLLFERAR